MKDTKHVKIVKAEFVTRWYATRVGEIFLVRELNDFAYKVCGNEGMAIFKADCVEVEMDNSKDKIDAHYSSFVYTLTEADKQKGTLKVDPYFVSNQWQLGSKDNTGVLFHCLKNISRYSDKNTKEREIIALFKQVKRLAELEKVDLEGQ